MKARNRRQTKSLVGTLFVAGIVASSAYAFTANISVNASSAGDGSAAVNDIAGTVTPTYILDATDGSKIATVKLKFSSALPSSTTVGQANTQVRARYGATGGSTNWTADCTPNPAGATATVWDCSFGASEPTVGPATQNKLEVSAVDKAN